MSDTVDVGNRPPHVLPFLQGAALCPFLVTPCHFLKAEITPCLFAQKNIFKFFFFFFVKKAGHNFIMLMMMMKCHGVLTILGQDSCRLETLHALNGLFIHVHMVVKVMPLTGI